MRLVLGSDRLDASPLFFCFSRFLRALRCRRVALPGHLLRQARGLRAQQHCDRAYCFDGECKRDCFEAERDCPKGWVCNLNAQCVPPEEPPTGTPDGGDPGDAGGAGGSGGSDPADASVDSGDEDASVEVDGGEDAEDGGEGGAGGSGGIEDDGGFGDDGGSGGRGGRDGGDDLDGGDEVDGGDEPDGGDVIDGGDEPDAGDDGGSSEDGGSSDDGGNQVVLGLLDRCTNDDECQGSSLCRPMWVGGPRRCTKTCTNSAQCMTGTRCEAIDSERYCAQSDIGRACSSDGDCNGRCMTLRGYCTSECTTGADCPVGYGCTGVGSPPVRMCVKVAVYCGDDASVCAGGAGYCDGSMWISSCTIPCSTANDCPQRATALGDTWKCTNGFCRRPGDVYGPIPGDEPTEYLCIGANQVRNVCHDGINTDLDAWYTPNPPYVSCSADRTTQGVPGDSCVDSCRYQGACAFGFACTAISAISGQRLGLCLPTGSGEVGEPCTKHRDCAFGYCNLDTNRCTRDCSADGICPSGSTCTATGAYIEGIPFKRCE